MKPQNIAQQKIQQHCYLSRIFSFPLFLWGSVETQTHLYRELGKNEFILNF